ncbi:hypothetical protein V8C37DRAFT_56071 [Trichoderma ceciliae]
MPTRVSLGPDVVTWLANRRRRMEPLGSPLVFPSFPGTDGGVSSDRPALSNHGQVRNSPKGLMAFPTASLARLSRRHLFLDLVGG